MSCCGKVICSGCRHAPVYDDLGNVVTEKKCPFCRSPLPDSDEGIVERYKKRVEANDVIAIHTLGSYYRGGLYGLSIDHTKALELWHRATELGYAGSYTCIGFACYYGQGVEINKKKAFHYWELAAIGGDLEARTNLGTREEKELGNMDRALKHYIIAVGGGYAKPLKKIKVMYSNGHATKEDYTKALRLYQDYVAEIKSVQRDKAAKEGYRYYER